MMTTVGFTGTRNGMTDEQHNKVVDLLQKIRPDSAVHGDCIGADEDFDKICKTLNIHTTIRPCTYEHLRAFCDSEVVAESKHPMQRNRDIVKDADILIACPPNFERIKTGSGTWATIGFGKRAGIDVIVVFPDGAVTSTNYEL